ncbi:SMI1/KNR4 family protein [Streptomyces sp. TP-A0356]|uniref:SMI1/KNR4 family protein n=1 Tax=Streptomyces sp. TP-A0356 TaxID=1359208 RepID=UPI001F3488D1|nr:SMI1/KNR4 family protein [Streptomyces sp. TP-A0356]
MDDLLELFGQPPAREPSPEDWAEVEDYLGSALSSDFKAFLDTYGTGVFCGELVVFHPRGSSPLLTRMRMRKIHESFGQSWRRDSDEYPFRFHPDLVA